MARREGVGVPASAVKRDGERAERHRRWRDWAQMVAGNTVAAIIAACIIGGPWLWVKRVLHVLFVVTSG